MIVAEVTAIAIVCTLMVITTNPRQNRPDGSKVHGMTAVTRAMMAGVQFLALICLVLSIPANASRIGLISAPIWLNISGLLLMACGVLLRVYSMRVLGRHYSTVLFVNKDQPLVTRGIYGVVRHPIYLGDLLLFVTAGVAVSNYVVLLVVSATCIPAYILRMHYEERMMVDHYGDAYIDYRRHTKRLIPFVY